MPEGVDMSSQHRECPKCGRPLEPFNGQIGRCAYHQEWFPVSKRYQEEANKMNWLERDMLRAEYPPREVDLMPPMARKKSRLPAVIFLLLLVTAAAAVLLLLFKIKPPFLK